MNVFDQSSRYAAKLNSSGFLHWLLPGRFLFKLTHASLDTRRLANGAYVATVTAIDESGNRSTLSERVEVWNPRR